MKIPALTHRYPFVSLNFIRNKGGSFTDKGFVVKIKP